MRDGYFFLGVVFFLTWGLGISAIVWSGNATGPSGEAIVSTEEKTLYSTIFIVFFSAVLAAITVIQYRAYGDLVRHGRVLEAEVVDFEKRGRSVKFVVAYTLDGNEFVSRRMIRGQMLYSRKGLGTGARIRVLVHESKPNRFLVLKRGLDL